MKKQIIAILLTMGALTISSAASAKELVVTQKNKKFSQKQVTIKVGDSLAFKNEDPYNHNIFSLSDTKSFDLGSYPQGQARSVTFDKTGIVEVQCSIHPDMKMTIQVNK